MLEVCVHYIKVSVYTELNQFFTPFIPNTKSKFSNCASDIVFSKCTSNFGIPVTENHFNVQDLRSNFPPVTHKICQLPHPQPAPLMHMFVQYSVHMAWYSASKSRFCQIPGGNHGRIYSGVVVIWFQCHSYSILFFSFRLRNTKCFQTQCRSGHCHACVFH